MLVLVGCEESQTVCKAFREIGCEAYSCDLQEPSGGHPEWHLQMDVFAAIKSRKWNLLIGHPPCKYLSYAATAYWHEQGRAQKRINALQFFHDMWAADVNRICLENPIGIVDNIICKYDQIVEPYYFGDSDKKRTCLWLKNLPPLVHSSSNNLFESKTHVQKPSPTYFDKSGARRYRTDALNSKQQKERSRFFPGIAKAMAEQWGRLPVDN